MSPSVNGWIVSAGDVECGIDGSIGEVVTYLNFGGPEGPGAPIADSKAATAAARAFLARCGVRIPQGVVEVREPIKERGGSFLKFYVIFNELHEGYGTPASIAARISPEHGEVEALTVSRYTYDPPNIRISEDQARELALAAEKQESRVPASLQSYGLTYHVIAGNAHHARLAYQFIAASDSGRQVKLAIDAEDGRVMFQNSLIAKAPPPAAKGGAPADQARPHAAVPVKSSSGAPAGYHPGVLVACGVAGLGVLGLLLKLAFKRS